MAERITLEAWQAIREHTGEYWEHHIQAAIYGDGESHTLECMFCSVVLAEVDDEDWEDEDVEPLPPL